MERKNLALLCAGVVCFWLFALAFGISDFDEKRYLITMLLGKGLMIAMMAVFGQSLVSSMKNPVYLVLAVLLWGGMYWVSKQFCKKHNLE
mgnify:CR=1 FL=1